MSIKKVLFVCTGNTCRSVMAHALLETALQDVAGPQVDSAGIASVPGSPAAPEALAVLRERGIDFSHHRSRPLTAAKIQQADLILVMTAAHREAIIAKYPAAESKVFLITEYAGEFPRDIQDPWGGNLEEYSRLARDLDYLLTKIKRKWRN